MRRVTWRRALRATWLVVASALPATSYALHAAFGKSSSGAARRLAAVDTAVLAVGGASVLVIVQLVVTIRDCSIGTGC